MQKLGELVVGWAGYHDTGRELAIDTGVKASHRRRAGAKVSSALSTLGLVVSVVTLRQSEGLSVAVAIDVWVNTGGYRDHLLGSRL